MAYTGITATEAEIDQKTGAGVSAAYTDTMKTQALLQAESYINGLSLFNWSDWFAASPNVDFKSIITEITASIVAIEAIKYNMSDGTTFASRVEAEDMINVLVYRIEKIEKLLADEDAKVFIQNQT